MDRTYDIVVIGASGYTGTLIMHQFAKVVQVVNTMDTTSSNTDNKPTIRLAMAGRDTSKLETIKADCLKDNPSFKNVDILFADTKDQTSIDNVVQKSKVILSAVGPYLLYGTPIVDACVRFKTDYCDITGETRWVRKMVDKYHREAEEKGVLLVPFVGYDSIPTDMSTFMVVDYSKNVLNRTCTHVESYVWTMKGGGLSGGTFASFLAGGISGSVYRIGVLISGSAINELSPEAKVTPVDKWKVNGFSYDKNIHSWTAPWVMEPINSRVVRRSALLNPSLYGDTFLFSETLRTKGFLPAFFTWLSRISMEIVQKIPFSKSILRKFGPKVGQGPPKDKAGYIEHRVIGFPESLNKEDTPQRVYGVFKANLNGYVLTAITSVDAALCLVKDREKLRAHGGLLTPSAAMGTILLDRLRKSGLTFEVGKNPF